MEETNLTTTETVDNSSDELSLEEQVSRALDEPTTEDDSRDTQDDLDDVNGQSDVSDKPTDNIPKCPKKFVNDKGEIDVNRLVKSYVELEPLLNEKAEWLKERAELLPYKEQVNNAQKREEENALEQGYSSLQEMQQVYEVANYEANEYAKYLKYIDEEDRDRVEEMLIDYSENPSDKLLAEIELEFAPEINKRVAIQSYEMKKGFSKNSETQKIMNIENVIKTSIENNHELFGYEPFSNLFENTLKRYGDNFTQDDANALMDTFVQMKELFRQEFLKGVELKNENNDATDRLASISKVNSAQNSSSNVDISKLSEKELANLVRQLI